MHPIEAWYGDRQRVGRHGWPQRWVHVLGRVAEPSRARRLTASLNGGGERAVSLGPDGHRLAQPGDFNVELGVDEVRTGDNAVRLRLTRDDGAVAEREVTVVVEPPQDTDLPRHIRWAQAGRIDAAAHVTDGRWRLTPQGVRVVEPYYDRVLAVGDGAWTDYEVRTTVTFHGLRQPSEDAGDAGANVIHAALATRWSGHDEDGRQPRVKWWPLGATAEFRVTPAWTGCSWRILGGGDVVVNAPGARSVQPETAYGMVHRVTTAGDGGAEHEVKLWDVRQPEPATWDLALHKDPDTTPAGGALLIAHYTEVTFGDVDILPA